MKSSVIKAVTVGAIVALSARFSEMIATAIEPANHPMHDYVGVTITFVVASVLFFNWRYQYREHIRLLQEREQAISHVHHHIRNALHTILMKYWKDPLVKEQSDRIIRELEAVLPSTRTAKSRR